MNLHLDNITTNLLSVSSVCTQTLKNIRITRSKKEAIRKFRTLGYDLPDNCSYEQIVITPFEDKPNGN